MLRFYDKDREENLKLEKICVLKYYLIYITPKGAHRNL